MTERKPSRTAWGDDGFAEPPEERTSVGGEIVYRAYGGSSRRIGNCFFAPAIKSTPIVYWTADRLELELNAALWGNDFHRIIKLQVLTGARFLIGPIAQDSYSGVDGSQSFFQRAYFLPSGILKQVKFVIGGARKLCDCVRVLDDFPVSAGRYAREASWRAKRLLQ